MYHGTFLSRLIENLYSKSYFMEHFENLMPIPMSVPAPVCCELPKNMKR